MNPFLENRNKRSFNYIDKNNRVLSIGEIDQFANYEYDTLEKVLSYCVLWQNSEQDKNYFQNNFIIYVFDDDRRVISKTNYSELCRFLKLEKL